MADPTPEQLISQAEALDARELDSTVGKMRVLALVPALAASLKMALAQRDELRRLLEALTKPRIAKGTANWECPSCGLKWGRHTPPYPENHRSYCPFAAARAYVATLDKDGGDSKP